MAWSYGGNPATHQDVQDVIAELRTAPHIRGLPATGTADANTYLRGDGRWASLPDGQSILTHSRNPVTGWFHLDAWTPDKTGATDSTAHLQAAVNALLAGGGGTLYVSPGRYRIDGTVYISPRDGVTPVRLLGEFTDAAEHMGTGTVFHKGNTGDMIRVNIRADGKPAFGPVHTIYSVAFENFAMEGTDAATTYGIRAYRCRVTMRRVASYKLDGLMMQDPTGPANAPGWDNYCDQSSYEDIRFAAQKHTGMLLTGCDSTTFNRISYQYPSPGAVYGIRLRSGSAASMTGALYSDGNHNAADTLQSFLDVEACSGLTINGVHIEEPDTRNFFDIKNSAGVSFIGVHTRFRHRTLFRFDAVRGASIDAWDAWSSPDPGSYDIEATTDCTDINYRSCHVASFVTDGSTNTRDIVVNDPGRAVSKIDPATAPRVARNYVDSSRPLTMLDGGRTIDVDATTPVTLTVPPSSTHAFPSGTVIKVLQYGTSRVTIVAGSGVTLRSRGGALHSSGQFSELTLTLRTDDEWILTGDLTS